MSKTFIKKTDMADRRKKIQRIYSDDRALKRLSQGFGGRGLGGSYQEDNLIRIINSVGLESVRREEIVDLSNFAYATQPVFADIIDYYANMFMWRYYYFPVEVRNTANKSNYGEIYDLMTSVVDGLNIEIIFPATITKLLTEGVVYLYTTRNTPSKTISTLLLNSAYCTPIVMSQYGTGLFSFNLEYFDDLGFRGEELQEIFELFPDEIVDGYLAWKNKTGEQEIILDGRFSTYISLNDFEFPTLINSLKGILDYDKYRANEVERSGAQLDTIVSHRIPAHENRLLFELEEIQTLHSSMSQIIGKNKRTKLITTFGDLDIHPIQEQSRVSNETLEKAHKAIYSSAGLNTELFNADNRDSLIVSLQKDQSIIWEYVQKLVNFYNLTMNNLYNFKGYQIELTMLPITHYNLRDMMELHRRNAEYGIGRLEAVVASGTKQKHIVHKGALEDFLKLDEILKPLESAHTRSGKDEKEKQEEEPIISPEEPNQNENEQDGE